MCDSPASNNDERARCDVNERGDIELIVAGLIAAMVFLVPLVLIGVRHA